MPELVDSFAWESLDPRFAEQPPRLSIGLVYCERPSRRGARPDDCSATTRSRTSCPSSDSTSRLRCPPGSSYDIARRLVALADQKMYEAKRNFADSSDPHIAQANVRIVAGKLVEI